MSLALKKKGTIHVLSHSGKLGIVQMGNLRNILTKLLDRGDKKVLVDLELTPDISWCAIGEIFQKSNEFRSKKGELKLSGLNDSMKNVFQTLGADSKAEFYGSESEAIKSFKTGP